MSDSRDAGREHEPTNDETKEREPPRVFQTPGSADAFSIETAFSEEVEACAVEWNDADERVRLRLLLDAFFGCGARPRPEAVAELIVSARLLALEDGGADPNAPSLLRKAALAEERLADRLAAVRGTSDSGISWADLGSALPAIVSEDPEVLWAPSVLFALETLLFLGTRALPTDDTSDRAREDLRRLAEELDLTRPSRRRKTNASAEKLAGARRVLAMITDPDGYGGTASLALRLVKACRSESEARRVLETTSEWAGLYSLRMTRDLAVQKGIRPGERNLALILHALSAFRWVPGRRGRVSERNVAAALFLVWQDAAARGADAGHRSVSRKELARKAIELRKGAESIVREATRAARDASFRRGKSPSPHGMRPSSVPADEPEFRQRQTEKEKRRHDYLPDDERGSRAASHHPASSQNLAVPRKGPEVREAEPLPLPVRRSRPRGLHAGEDVLLDRGGDRQPRDRRGGRVRKPP